MQQRDNTPVGFIETSIEDVRIGKGQDLIAFEFWLKDTELTLYVNTKTGLCVLEEDYGEEIFRIVIQA